MLTLDAVVGHSVLSSGSDDLSFLADQKKLVIGRGLLEAIDDVHTHVHIHCTNSLAAMNNYPGFHLYYAILPD